MLIFFIYFFLLIRDDVQLDDDFTSDDLLEIAKLLQCSQTEFAEMLRKMDRDLLFVLRTT